MFYAINLLAFMTLFPRARNDFAKDELHKHKTITTFLKILCNFHPFSCAHREDYTVNFFGPLNSSRDLFYFSRIQWPFLY